MNSSFSVEQNGFINNAGGRGNGGGLSLRGDSCRSLTVRIYHMYMCLSDCVQPKILHQILIFFSAAD